MMSAKSKKLLMRKKKTVYSSIQNLHDIATQENSCNCIIEYLLQNPLYSLTYAKKVIILENGPPKPSICSIINVKYLNKERSIREVSMIYEMTPWMCCCKKFQKLYCWQCLLFSREKNVWNRIGFDDFGNLNSAGENHRLSCNHILSSKELKLFEKSRKFINQVLSDEYTNDVKKYNETVTHNRNILSYVIAAVCFLGSQGLSFYELHNRGSENLNNVNTDERGNYFKLINIFADYNKDLMTHIRTPNKFSVLSSTIYNDIIFCISEVMMQELKKEIDDSLFVTLILNEITHFNLMNQLSTVFRYVDKNGNVKERFLNFIDLINTKRSLHSLRKCMLKIISEFNCASKLIAYSLDSIITDNQELESLQKTMREKCATVLFINSHSNKLSTILTQSVYFIKEVKVFFSALSAFREFFRRSDKKVKELDPEIFLSMTPEIWDHPSCLVTVIYENKNKIENLFLTIIIEPFNWDLNTISMAFYLFSVLKDFDFIFFLEVFYNTIPVADTLCMSIQKYILFDLNFCLKKIERFILNLQESLKGFEAIWKSVCKIYFEPNSDTKITDKISKSISGETKASCYKFFNLIIETFISVIVIRYNNLLKLQFFNLLDGKKFTQFKTRFPDAAFCSLEESYGSFFDLSCLKSELTVLYNDKNLIKDSLLKLYNYLQKLELVKIFVETSKLCELILTLPVVLVESEKDFSALTRIYDYINNSQVQHQRMLTSVAIMSIESSYLDDMRSKTDFEDKVFSIFATQNHNIELLYKDY